MTSSITISSTTDLPRSSTSPDHGTISLCMIVKNEEDVLLDCLSSVQGLVDEIVIIDTGSTDKTLDVARKFKANMPSITISSILWTDDFSAAKNAAIRRATKQWILWLDADEVLPASEHEKVRKAIAEADQAEPRIEGYRTPIMNFIRLEKNEMLSGAAPLVSSPETAVIEAKGANASFTSTTIRLFRNSSGLYFVGRVHELLNKDSDTSVIAPSTITIHHAGYLRSGSRRMEKQELYLQLGREKAEQEKTPESYVELGALYAGRGQPHHAKAYLQKAIQLKPNVPEWYYNLAVLHKKLSEYGKAEEVLRKAIFLDEKTAARYLSLDPYPFIFASLGEIFMRQRKYNDALFMLTKARKGHPNKDIIGRAIQQCMKQQEKANLKKDQGQAAEVASS